MSIIQVYMKLVILTLTCENLARGMSEWLWCTYIKWERRANMRINAKNLTYLSVLGAKSIVKKYSGGICLW